MTSSYIILLQYFLLIGTSIVPHIAMHQCHACNSEEKDLTPLYAVQYNRSSTENPAFCECLNFCSPPPSTQMVVKCTHTKCIWLDTTVLQHVFKWENDYSEVLREFVMAGISLLKCMQSCSENQAGGYR